MQHRITQPSNLLDHHGRLIQTGYATSPLLIYNRKDVAKKFRLKEWDYYSIASRKWAFTFTVGNSIGFLLISATLLDFRYGLKHSKTVVRFVPKWKLPESSQTGDILYKDKRVELSIVHKRNRRYLSLYMEDFLGPSDLEAYIVLSKEPRDSMVIATPFTENSKYFYYNRKIIGMAASGYIRVRNRFYSFKPRSSFGVFDWGRGVWPYKTNWYWSCAHGFIGNNAFGFNLGYGFGDTSAATENMLFFNGIANKLAHVRFYIERKNGRYEYMKPWLVTSSDNRIKMFFLPIIHRAVKLSIIFLSTDQHLIFGRFYGRAVLNDGKVIFFKGLPGFIERFINRW